MIAGNPPHGEAHLLGIHVKKSLYAEFVTPERVVSQEGRSEMPHTH